MEKRFGTWIVDDAGITHEPSQYFIEAKVLTQADYDDPQISQWAHHIIRKTWVDPEDFVPAFRHALERFAPDISWPETLKSLQREAYIEICRQEVARRDPAGDHYSTVISDELDRLLACAWRPRKLPEPVVPAVRIEEDEDD